MTTEKRPPVLRRATRGCVSGLSLLAVLCLAHAALAAEPKAAAKKPEEAPPTIRLTLRPAAEPRPALKYHLLPPLLDRQPGNAAVFYNKAALMYQQNPELVKQGDKVSQWNDLPLDKLPLDEIEKTLAPWSTVFAEIGFAVKREQCDWQLPIREQVPFTILLPEFQTLRAVARALRLKARWQVAKRQYNDAVDTLANMYAMARHCGAGQTLIQGLVGISFVGMIAQIQEDLAGQPGAPNLYWALTWLPRPFIDLRQADEFEMETIYLWMPELRRLDQSRSADAWRDLFDGLAGGLADFESVGDKNEERLILLGKAIQGYPRAKQELIAAGRLPEQVEAMPVAQVLLLHTMRTYDDLRDNQFKWMGLPFWQAHDGLEQAASKLGHEARRREIIPLAQLFLPAVQHASNAQARGERTIAMLRTIEALRLYAAAHDGRLPKQLDDIGEVPVPHDPLTGGPFIYESSDNTAVLEAPLLNGMAPQLGKRYEISVTE